MTNLLELLENSVRELHQAELQLVKFFPRIARKASSQRLKEALAAHLTETEGQVRRLEMVGQHLGIKVTGKKCRAMEGLIEQADEAIKHGSEGPVMDAAIIGAIQGVEHYEIACYGTARTMATKLGHGEVARILQETLDEEAAADKWLSNVAEREILMIPPETGDADYQRAN